MTSVSAIYRFLRFLAAFAFGAMSVCAHAPGQQPANSPNPGASAEAGSVDDIDQAIRQAPTRPDRLGTISGRVVDPSGAPVVGAHVRLLAGEPASANAQDGQGNATETNGDGIFSFLNVVPGPFRVQVTQDGFAAREAAGML